MNFSEMNFSRRDLLKTGGALSAAGLLMILNNACSSRIVSTNYDSNKLPRKLSGEKIQDPRHYGIDGCMTGVYLGGFSASYAIENTYKELTGQFPSFYMLPYIYQSHIPIGISKQTIDRMVECSDLGVIPFVTYDARIGNHAPRSITTDIAKGKYDKRIIETAEDLKEFGEQYGGFFIRMFREMNLSADWAWAGNPGAHKDAWKHVWDIFEKTGTNHYATWVWNPCVDQGKDTGERYFPGEEFVDWIGLNGYNWGDNGGRSAISFSALFYSAYAKHARKGLPMMISEIGADQYGGKAGFIRNAYDVIKNDFRNIRGISWWSTDFVTPMGHSADSRINSSSSALNALKEQLDDPYFLKKVPYKTIK